MKLYYVETNAYDMIVADFDKFRRVHVLEDKPHSALMLLMDVAEFPQNLSGDDYYFETTEDLIGDGKVIYKYTSDDSKKYLHEYPLPDSLDYDDLREAAIRLDATQGDRMNLLRWMNQYALDRGWNPVECFWDIGKNGDGLRLYPIDEPIAFDGEGEPEIYEEYDAVIKKR